MYMCISPEVHPSNHWMMILPIQSLRMGLPPELGFGGTSTVHQRGVLARKH